MISPPPVTRKAPRSLRLCREPGLEDEDPVIGLHGPAGRRELHILSRDARRRDHLSSSEDRSRNPQNGFPSLLRTGRALCSWTQCQARIESTARLSSVAPVPSRVVAGEEVGRTVVDPRVRMALEAGAPTSSLDAGELAQLRALRGPIVAPVSGLFRVEKGQPFVRDPGVDVVVDLLPIQYLRYQSLEFSGWASIETLVGERRVACAAVWVQPSAGKTAGVDVPYELHCRLPSYVETAAGLRSSLELRFCRLRRRCRHPKHLCRV